MRGINANVNTVNQAATEKSTTKRCKNKAHATDNNASTQLMQVSTMSTLSEAKESSKQAKLKYRSSRSGDYNNNASSTDARPPLAGWLWA